MYAIYPDMLLAAVIVKVFRPKTKIYYEIQDYVAMGKISETFYNFLINFCYEVYLTSQWFLRDFAKKV